MNSTIGSAGDPAGHDITSQSVAVIDQTVSEVPLRTKGFLAFIAVAIYAVLLTTFTFNKKAELVAEFERLQNLYKAEEQLRQVDATAFHIVMAVFLNSNKDDEKAVVQRFQSNLELLKKKNNDLTMRYPAAGVNLSRIEQAVSKAAEHPSPGDVAIMNSELLKVKIEITQHIDESRKEQEATAERFHILWDSAALASLLFGLIGLLLLGAIIGLFFTRLTHDLHILKARALGIIRGQRDASMPVTRNDEVGELMQAVNQMASALDEREKELVIARQKYFHQEKMAAVGALAAGVAHEIGNPIAAMSGVLQEMAIEQSTGRRKVSEGSKLALLQANIHRLSAITREISEFAAPQPMERQLLDLNGLARTTTGLMSYDKRMQRVNLQLNLDSQLPAIYGVADQLTQVIMNLLINAADALETAQARDPSITLRTEVLDGNVRLTVADNGCGMDQDTLNRVFEAFFTTKRKGNGLGLSLCYSIITGHGGTIEISSTPGVGTQVQIILPLPTDEEGDTL
ncbi:MAG: HAMP domain-containing protein [Nitrosomonadales bacterium]|nr:HAMP domain-containing protein [Nitrosomonadales bacterium]